MSASRTLTVAASLCAIGLVATLAVLWWKHQQGLHDQVHQKLLAMASQSNGNGPRMVDSNTRLDNIDVTGLRLRYNYTLVNSAEDIDSNFSDTKKRLKFVFAEKLCAIVSWKNDLLDNGVIVEYAYKSKSDRFIGSISISHEDCE